MNRDHTVIFEIASKYCILDSFVYCDGYTTSSKGFLPTVIDTMVIWVRFTHSRPFQITDFLKCHRPLLPSPVWPLALIHGCNILGSYAVLLFTASDCTSITHHIHNWVLFLLWLHLFILSGVISPLISSIILGTYRPGKFSVLSFCLFMLCMGFSSQEYWSSLPFPSPVEHILSELFTMTSLSWVALYGMAHSFIELHKAVVHMIRLVSFLWLWFPVCLPSDGEG